MPLHATGVVRIIGCVCLFTWSQEPYDMRASVLLVPQWPSAPFWPMLFPNGADPAVFISDYVLIPKSEVVVHPGRLGSNLFKNAPNTNLLALHLSFGAQ